MHLFSGRAPRIRLIATSVVLALAAPVCISAQTAGSKTAVSADPQVRLSQQWEDVLLLEDFDYMQLSAPQIKVMLTLADYARTRTDEIEQLRLRLQKTVQDQHEAILKGQRPTAGDQQDVLQKQKLLQERQDVVSREIVDRLSPKLGGILTRKQTVRAWLLMQNKLPATEPKRIALTDLTSGFVFPQMEVRDTVEEMVKTSLREKYSPDVLDQALTPWEFASLGALMGGPGGLGSGGGFGGPGGGGPGGGAPPDPGKAIQAIQDMDPRMGQRMMLLGQRMLKQFSGGGADPNAPAAPPVAPEVRAAINKDAAAIRKSLETDPEGYLTQAPGNQMLEALRPLAKRLFLSPRLKEALTARAAR